MRVVFRVDGNETMGIGHFMRCFAFAQLLKDENIQVDFLTTTNVEYLLDMLKAEYINIERFKVENMQDDIKLTINYLISSDDIGLIILDGYHFDTNYHKALRKIGLKVLCIDDLAQMHFECDYVLNQNLGSLNLNYSIGHSTKLLLGPKYWLWRREFRQINNEDALFQVSPKINKIFLTLGGGDITSQLRTVINYLGDLDLPIHIHFKILIGYSDQNILSRLITEFPFKIELIPHSNDVSKLIQWSDLVITGAGTTLYEVLYLRRPLLICALIDNQIPSANEAFNLQMSLPLNINSFDSFSETFNFIFENHVARKEMVKNQKKFFTNVGITKNRFYEFFN
ncbi:MAG: UDP-2,4-diacetamido-2,4,6-trideoxy-beta-L-altropyranose hydrolase [Candidatus Marinimicrobia bacterium]|nr:UDP-2,4-diacetamido-2,4,6-trideoxy-beta-L-altropyranose hydrolase [Candidatus Neomarinimicrobiota bacterium]